MVVTTKESEQKAKLLKLEKFKKKNSSSKKLLSEIISLGGDKTDLDLIRDVLSGSEREDNDDEQEQIARSPPSALKIDEKTLEKDLAAFVKTLDIQSISSQLLLEEDSDGDLNQTLTEPVSVPYPIEDEKKENISSSAPLTKKEKKKLRKARLQEAKQLEESKKQEISAAAAVDLSKISNEFLKDVHLNEEEDPLQGLDREMIPLGKENVEDVQSMVDDILNGKEPTEKTEWTNGLLFESDSNMWYQNSLEEVPPVTCSQNADLVAEKYAIAESLWKADAERYEKRRLQKSKASRDFINTVLKNGTVTDKVSALTLLVQESPVHNLNYFSQYLLQGMAKKKSRREAILAVDSIKDLLLNNLLPDRKLKYFVDQPCLSKKASNAHLIAWFFEDALKKAYFEFLQVLEELSKDILPHVKSKVLSCVFDLLRDKPEQEENLLTLLVNKLGDLDRKIASKATHLLCQLLLHHPVMKDVVLGEVERLLLRPNIAERARYYAVTFLNQIVLTRTSEDTTTANSLILLYFTVFTALVKSMEVELTAKKGPIKKDRSKSKQKQKEVSTTAALVEIDGLNSKMMSGLLTGVNRAFPFSKLDSEIFDKHLDTLFQVSHLGSFTTSVQALTLVFQVQTSRNQLSDRFYRALYDSLFDKRLHEASKQAMYLNLVYRALKSDSSIPRIRSFAKRLVQSISIASVPLICGSLFLLSELFNQKVDLWSLVTEKEERYNGKEVRKYDSRKRDPLYAQAEYSCLWEIIPFTIHFHPTVSLYAKTILSGNALAIPKDATNYDPLLNHTLARFLERFVYKAPKKVKTIYHGNSLMQPRGQSNLLVTGGRRKQNAIFEDDENDGALIALDDAPVNSKKWTSENEVAADEVFFYKFFKNQKKDSNSAKEDLVKELSDVESNMEDLEENEIWEAMTRSKGFDKAALEIDIDDDELDLEMHDLPSNYSDSSQEDSEDRQFDDESDKDGQFDDESDKDGHSEGLDDDGNDMDEMIDDDNVSSEGEDLSGFFEDEDFSDSELPLLENAKAEKDSIGSKKRPKQMERLSSIASKLGYKGGYFDVAKNTNEFASADDFSALIEQQESDFHDEEESHAEPEVVPKINKRKSRVQPRLSKRAKTT